MPCSFMCTWLPHVPPAYWFSAFPLLPVLLLLACSFEDTWQIFGEGRHPRFDELFERRLKPFLSQVGW